MRPWTAVTALLFLAACYGTSDAPDAEVAAPDEVRILGGPVECAGCARFDFQIAGPDVLTYDGAAFVSSDGTDRDIHAQIDLRRYTGDSGVVLQASVVLMEPLPVGTYDLRLTSSRTAAERRIVPALHVTRLSGPGGTGGTGGGTGGGGTGGGGTGGGGTPPPPPPPADAGTVRVTLTSSGPDAPARFPIYGSDGSYYGAGFYDEAPPGQHDYLLPAGQYTVSLTLPINCVASGGAERVVAVTKDSVTSVAFAVTCTAVAYIEVSATFSGDSPAGQPWVECAAQRCTGSPLSQPPVVLQAIPGPVSVQLSLPANCQASGANPVAVTAVAGATVPVAFQVTCVPNYATLRISLHSTGVARFVVNFGYDGCEGYYYCDAAAIYPGTTVTETVPIGQVYVALFDIPSGCTLTSPNPLRFAVTGGSTVDVAFDVSCP